MDIKPSLGDVLISLMIEVRPSIHVDRIVALLDKYEQAVVEAANGTR